MTEVQVDKIENFTPAYGSHSHLHRVECARIGLLRPLIILRCNHRSASCPSGKSSRLAPELAYVCVLGNDTPRLPRRLILSCSPPWSLHPRIHRAIESHRDRSQLASSAEHMRNCRQQRGVGLNRETVYSHFLFLSCAPRHVGLLYSTLWPRVCGPHIPISNVSEERAHLLHSPRQGHARDLMYNSGGRHLHSIQPMSGSIAAGWLVGCGTRC